MIAHVRLQCRRHPQRLVTPHEIVVHEVQADRVAEVFQLLAEPVRQASEAAHLHPHRQILPFDVARRNLRFVRLSADDVLRGPAAFAGTVARLWCRVVALLAVVLHEHRVVHLATEASFHRFQLHPVAVCRDLDAVRQSAREVIHEGRCIARRPVAVQPMRAKFCVGVNRYEGPNVADAEDAFHADGNVLLLGITESPNLVDLQPLARQVLHHLALIVGACLPNVYE